MHNFTAQIKAKEAVSLTASNFALALFTFTFRRQTKRYFVYDVTSGQTWYGVHFPKYNFSEQHAAEYMAKNGYSLNRLELV